jgi:transposase
MALNLSNFEEKVNLLLLAKTAPKVIATTLKKPLTSIYNSISRIKRKKRSLINSKRVKAGRVSKLNSREKRVINRDLLLSPKKTNKRILFENSLKISTRSLQRVLKEEGYTINVATKKPYVDAKNAKLLVKYAKETLKSFQNKEINLKKVIFSDESSIERGHGARPEYARKKGKKLPGKEMISSTNKSTFQNISNRLFYSIFFCLFCYNFSFLIAIILT